MRTSIADSVRGVVFAACLVGFAAAQEPAKAKALLVTGQNNHDWQWTTTVCKEILEKTGRFEVLVTEKPAQFMADAAALAPYSLIFLNYNGERWGEPAESNFVKTVTSGAGVFVLHAADNAFPGWKEFEAIVGHCWRDGTGHGNYHAFDVRVVDRNHPVTFDLPDLKAHPDELYHKLVVSKDAKFRVVMDAFSDPKTGGTGKWEPMGIVLEYGKGRIFHTPLGHVWPGVESSRATFADPQMAMVIARGAEWAAFGAASSKPEDFGVPPRAPGKARPREPWVSRSVVDGRSRMITMAFHDDCWAIYDTAAARLYRVGPGSVAFRGAVFDGEHGPQPRTRGAPFLTEAAEPWRLQKNGRSDAVPHRIEFKGYVLEKDGAVTLKYRLRSTDAADPADVTIAETIWHDAASTRGFRQHFLIAGLPQAFAIQHTNARFNVATTVREQGAGGPRERTAPEDTPNMIVFDRDGDYVLTYEFGLRSRP